MLWSETSKKTLIISCKVRVIESTENMCSKITVKPRKSEDFCEKMFQFFLNDEPFHDITISVQEKEFKAHKAILAARSRVFAAMFSNKMLEKINSFIEIKDLKQERLERCSVLFIVIKLMI